MDRLRDLVDLLERSVACVLILALVPFVSLALVVRCFALAGKEIGIATAQQLRETWRRRKPPTVNRRRSPMVSGGSSLPVERVVTFEPGQRLH